MNYIDFFIGALLMNAMPHFVFGLTKTHFLGLFGYSPKGNIIYATLQFCVCLCLYIYNYGYQDLIENGYLIGGITILILYFVFGKTLVKFYGKQQKTIFHKK